MKRTALGAFSPEYCGGPKHPYWRILYRRRHIVLLVVAATLGPVAFVQSLMRPIYRASARIVIEKPETIAEESWNAPDIGELVARAYKPDLISKVIDNLRLEKHPQRWVLPTHFSDAAFPKREISVTRVASMTAFASQLISRPNSETPNAIQLEFLSPDAVLSASITNAAVEILAGQRHSDMNIPPADQRLLSEIDSNIRQIRMRIDQFKDGQSLADIVHDISKVMEAKGALVERLRSTEAMVVESELNYNNLLDQDGTINRAALRSDALGALRARWIEMEADWDKTVKRYRRRHPEYAAAQRNRDALATEIRNEENRLVDEAKGRYQTAKTELDALENQHKEFSTRLLQLEDYRKSLDTLKTDLAQLEERRQNLSDRIARDHNVRAQQIRAEFPGLYVDSWAEPPANPEGKSLSFILVLALIASFAGGSGLAFLTEYYDHSVRSLEMVAHLTGIAPMAGIPSSKVPRSLSLARITHDIPHAKASRIFEALRESLDPFMRSHNIRSVAICSALPEEGRTTVALNLATAFAHAGLRVLVLDGDFRGASVHEIFHNDGGLGLSDLLSQKKKIKALVSKVDILGLSILPAGRAAQDSVDLVAGTKMRQILARLGEDYDLIVVDTPACLMATDAALLSGIVDASLFVIRSGIPKKHELQMAIRRLTSSGGKIIGIVLNCLDGYDPLVPAKNVDALERELNADDWISGGVFG